VAGADPATRTARDGCRNGGPRNTRGTDRLDRLVLPSGVSCAGPAAGSPCLVGASSGPASSPSFGGAGTTKGGLAAGKGPSIVKKGLVTVKKGQPSASDTPFVTSRAQPTSAPSSSKDEAGSGATSLKPVTENDGRAGQHMSEQAAEARRGLLGGSVSTSQTVPTRPGSRKGTGSAPKNAPVSSPGDRIYLLMTARDFRTD